MSEYVVLPDVEDSIQHYIDQKLKEYDLSASFPNKLLRDDVLDMLDRFCTVVYYPLPNEQNNGFHVTNIPFADGKKQNFVFINTAQTMEKQVFTAAHELGHIWEVDKYIVETFSIEDTTDVREGIINRFAAELLIPKEIFMRSFISELEKAEVTGTTVSADNLFKIIVNLMNLFFVPMKAIVLRFLELQIIDQKAADFLLGKDDLSKMEIRKIIDKIISDNGFTKLKNASNKKWIDGLVDYLEIAEQKKLLPQSKIDRLRKAFDISPSVPFSPEFSNEVPITTQKGNDV